MKYPIDDKCYLDYFYDMERPRGFMKKTLLILAGIAIGCGVSLVAKVGTGTVEPIDPNKITVTSKVSYTYDAKLGNQEYFLTAQYPLERPKNIKCLDNNRMENYPDALLHKGDSIQVGSYLITVVSSGNVDQVRIEKK